MQTPDDKLTASPEVLAFLRAMARKGGLVRNAKRAAASRENGKLGGRPRKSTVTVNTNNG